MPYTQSSTPRRMLAFAALGVVGLMPVLAQAQFNVNSLYGKKFADVKKLLGAPVESSGSPIVNFSRFKTPGSIDTIVWYFANTGEVAKVQIVIVPKPGETSADAEKVLKRYGLAIGPNPRVFPGVKPPAKSMVSNGAVPGMPWTKIFISYLNAMSFKPSTVQYIKQHHLTPGQAFFWTIQVSTRANASRMIGAGDTGASDAGSKKKKKGSGKKKKG